MPLHGKKGLIVGIANGNSIAYGCAAALGAASGIERFDELLECARSRTPEHRLVGIEDVGNLATFPVGDGAAALTGNIEYIDAGYHVIG